MKRTYLLLILPIFFLAIILVLQLISWGRRNADFNSQNPDQPIITSQPILQTPTPIVATPTFTATPITTTIVPSTNTPAVSKTITPTPTTSVIATPTSATYKTPVEITLGNSSKKQLIFTFDCGSGAESAQKILDVAKSHNVKVTFFVTGKFIENNTALVKNMASAGHEIYNHSYSHPHLPELSDEQIRTELQKTENLLKNATGITSKPYFRLPYGDHGTPPSRVWDVAGHAGYQSIFWTLDALDWNAGNEWNGSKVDNAFVKSRVLGNLKNGAIILMHVGDNITGDILDEVFINVEAQGYSIVTLSKGL